MGKLVSKGICFLCNTSHSKGSMARHLETCRIKNPIIPDGKKAPRKTRVFHIAIEGKYSPDYWMHIDTPVNSTLEDIDLFLRHIWLECCGHLSQFTINGEVFNSFSEDEEGENEMDLVLSEVLRPGMKFFYEYDFGSSTNLVLKVLGEQESAGKALLLARNIAPAIPCSSCGKSAVSLCAECNCSDEGWLCEKCAQEHDCGEDMLLPVANSPRVGVCGYTGP